jgi:hypothetical protein
MLSLGYVLDGFDGTIVGFEVSPGCLRENRESNRESNTEVEFGGRWMITRWKPPTV